MECACNTGGMARDYGLNVKEMEQFDKALLKYDKEWTEEFLQQQREIINSKKIEDLIYAVDLFRDVWRFVKACKNYDQIYESSQIYYEIILNEELYKFPFYLYSVYDIYSQYYHLFFFDDRLYLDILENFKEKTLIEYLKINKPEEFKKVIEQIEVIIQKDKFKDSNHKEIIKKLREYF